MFTKRRLPYDRLREVGHDYHAICCYILQNGGEITGSFVRYTDDRRLKIKDMEICFSVKELLPASGDIKAKVIPKTAAKMARGIHKGSYEGLAAFHEEMDQWFNEQGLRRASAPIWEIYINSPDDVSEEELLTEILQPIE